MTRSACNDYRCLVKAFCNNLARLPDLNNDDLCSLTFVFVLTAAHVSRKRFSECTEMATLNPTATLSWLVTNYRLTIYQTLICFTSCMNGMI